jgi:hypothetical protein
MLHHRCICGNCVGYNPNISCSHRRLSCLWARLDEFISQFFDLFFERCERSHRCWTYSTFYGKCMYCYSVELEDMLTQTDCMDLLLWIDTFRRTPRIPRLVRLTQGSQDFAGWKRDDQWLRRWPTRHIHIFQRAPPDVHVCSTRWLRDVVPCCGIPRRSSWSRAKFLAAKIWRSTNNDKQPGYKWAIEQRTYHWRGCGAHRIPI